MAQKPGKRVALLRKRVKRLKAKLREARAVAAPEAVVSGPLISPLAPDAFPELPDIAGVRLATIQAGVRYKNRTDVMLAELVEGTTIAGVFTRSATRSAPVLDCEAKRGGAPERRAAILVNSGNSNAFTGAGGVSAVGSICNAVADELGLSADRVFTSSTGVIGEPLPYERITARIADLKAALAPGGLEDAARAIMTTDTFPKGSSRQIQIGGKTVSISGIAKGSGMIAPDMGTMLVYIFTDATVAQDALQAMLSAQTDPTFNSITVDSDTSTSDTLLLAATGAAGAPAITDAESADGKTFCAALGEVMTDLAHQVVRDGEGATKFVEIQVTGAADAGDARKVGMSIANSPLIKTAIAGQDPNWGRVVMAVGKSGAQADRDRLTIRFGDVKVAENGWRSPDYSEADAAAHMKGEDILIAVDLGLGSGSATIWTCDFTKRYIEINADYRS